MENGGCQAEITGNYNSNFRQEIVLLAHLGMRSNILGRNWLLVAI